MKSGIYKITNLANNISYIGSSNNIERRKGEHFKSLNKGNHYNTKLQRSWNKYGSINFIFEVILECENYKEEEQKILDNINYKKSFNIMNKAIGGYSGKDMSGENHPRSKKISVFDLQMNFIEEIHGVRNASRKYKVGTSITRCCKGEISNSGGYIFRYSDNTDIKYERKKYKWKPREKYIVVHDINGGIVGTFNTIIDASVETKVSTDIINSDLKSLPKSLSRRKIKLTFSYNKIK